MGYVRKKIYNLKWPEGTELGPSEDNPEGLQLSVTSTSIDTFLLVKAITDGQHPEQFDNDSDKEFTFIVEEFGKCLVSWNLEEEVTKNGRKKQVPVPPNEIGLRRQDREFVLIVTTAWCLALHTVNHDLKGRSKNSEQSEEEPVLMEPLSESPTA